MKSSLVSHYCVQKIVIDTTGNKFKLDGKRITLLYVTIESALNYLHLGCDILVEGEDSKDTQDYELILSILEDATAPESVINLVKLHRQQNENKKSNQ